MSDYFHDIYICFSCVLSPVRDLKLKPWMDARPVALSAATGSLSSCLLWPAGGPVDISCPLPEKFGWNFWAGVAVGFCLWPILEICVLCKQWITLALRSRISQFGLERIRRLYKVL